MRRKFRPVVSVGAGTLILSLAACGGFRFEKELEKIDRAAPVAPIASERLQTFFPLFEGWHKGKTRNSAISTEMAKEGFTPENTSSAMVSYTQIPPGFNIDARISDSVPLAKSWSKRNENDVKQGHLTRTRIAGFPAWEGWRPRQLWGQVCVVVNKRFVFRAEGKVESLKVLQELAEKADLKGLAGLK